MKINSNLFNFIPILLVLGLVFSCGQNNSEPVYAKGSIEIFTYSSETFSAFAQPNLRMINSRYTYDKGTNNGFPGHGHTPTQQFLDSQCALFTIIPASQTESGIEDAFAAIEEARDQGIPGSEGTFCIVLNDIDVEYKIGFISNAYKTVLTTHPRFDNLSGGKAKIRGISAVSLVYFYEAEELTLLNIKYAASRAIVINDAERIRVDGLEIEANFFARRFELINIEHSLIQNNNLAFTEMFISGTSRNRIQNNTVDTMFFYDDSSLNLIQFNTGQDDIVFPELRIYLNNSCNNNTIRGNTKVYINYSLFAGQPSVANEVYRNEMEINPFSENPELIFHYDSQTDELFENSYKDNYYAEPLFMDVWVPGIGTLDNVLFDFGMEGVYEYTFGQFSATYDPSPLDSPIDFPISFLERIDYEDIEEEIALP